MRAALMVMAMAGAVGVVAQDPVEVPGVATPEHNVAQWSFKPTSPGAGSPFVPAARNKPVELAGRPAPVCAVKLLEMPIPKDVTFTMKKVTPRRGIDDGILVAPPAPACP